MLVLRRREGQWIEMRHSSGDVIRFRVYNINGGPPGQINLAFDDAERKFEIHRPERIRVRAEHRTPPVPHVIP